MNETEIIVVDNDPGGQQGAWTRQFLEAWVRNARYIPYTDVVGSAAPKDQVFRNAAGRIVVCIDAHVLIAIGALQRLVEFYRREPDSDDLFHGPLLLDDLGHVVNEMLPVWRNEMFGIWGESRPAADCDFEDAPDIGMHGCGLFVARAQTWLGFNPGFRGFGGEEGYIHEKYRRAGRRVRLLPFLKWAHRFTRSDRVKYPLTKYHKVRNYLLGWSEVGLPLRDVIEHFKPVTPAGELYSAIRDAGVRLSS